MRIAVILYHSNAESIYPLQWIEECVKSIYNQTYKKFDVIELNYGEGAKQYTNGEFHKIPMRNHIEAMNYLIDICLAAGYDVVANTNIDDTYASNRIEVQVEAIRQGYQLVSSNFRYIGGRSFIFHPLNIGDNLAVNHNVIAHPAVMMHRSFWDEDLHYKDIVGYEDLDLWQRAYAKGKRFYICPDILLNYRLHDKQTGRINPARL